MTILVVLKVASGLVLAADSRLSVLEAGRTVFVSDSNTKLFAVRDRPVGILTCGSSFLEGRAVASWLDEFCEHQAPGETTLAGMAEALVEWIPAPASDSITFVLAGFDPGATHGPDAGILKVNKFATGVSHSFDLSASAIFWDGEFEAITRLLLGFAPAYVEVLTGSERFGAGEARMPYYAFSLAEGIDYVRFLVTTQIQFQRFVAIPQTCGGPVDVAILTPVGGFEWIVRK